MRWLILAVLAACTPTGVAPVTPPDAAIDPACAVYCSHLAQLGCREGADPQCPAACTATEGSPLSPVNWSCVANAATRGAVQTCGVRLCQ